MFRSSARVSALEQGVLAESTPQHARRVREVRSYPQGPTRGSERLRSERSRCEQETDEARVSPRECENSAREERFCTVNPSLRLLTSTPPTSG